MSLLERIALQIMKEDEMRLFHTLNLGTFLQVYQFGIGTEIW